MNSKEINNVDAIFSLVEDELKDRNNRIYKVAETPHDYVLCDENNNLITYYETDKARRFLNVKEGEYWYGTDIFLLELRRADFETIDNSFELLDEDGLEQTLINMPNRKYMILIKNILGEKGIDMLLKDLGTRFSFETVDENYKSDGHFGYKFIIDETWICTQLEIKFRFWVEDGKIKNEPVWESEHYIERTTNKNKKHYRPFTTVDFKDGFKAQLAKYNYPILKRISDELWYELLNIEEECCGNCKYIKKLLKEIRTTYMLSSPIKQAEYLITLRHKAFIYKNIEPELSNLYESEYEEIFYKLVDLYANIDSFSVRQFEAFHSIINIDVPDYDKR